MTSYCRDLSSQRAKDGEGAVKGVQHGIVEALGLGVCAKVVFPPQRSRAALVSCIHVLSGQGTATPGQLRCCPEVTTKPHSAQCNKASRSSLLRSRARFLHCLRAASFLHLSELLLYASASISCERASQTPSRKMAQSGANVSNPDQRSWQWTE